MNLTLRIIISVYILFTVYACAVISSPTGGPKDEIPPRFGASTPFNGQTNVDTTKLKITLYFDEYVQEEKLRQNLIITPYKPTFQYKSRFARNKVIINVLDTLEQDMTYFFDFGNSIVDVTEKNPAKNVRFSFSTGDYLDSLEVTGQVRDLLTDEPIEGAIIALYDPYDSLDVNTDPPVYFSRTVKDGLFILERFKPGYYKVYCIDDTNGDYKYTLREERIGFFSDSILLDRNIDDVQLFVRDYDLVDFKFNNVKVDNKEDLLVKFNKFAVEYDIDFPEKNSYTDSIFHQDQKGEIKLIYIGERDMEDSLRMTGYAIDSIEQRIEFDTMIMFPSRSEIKAEERKEKNKKNGGLIGGALKSIGDAVGVTEEEEEEIVRIKFDKKIPEDNDLIPEDSVEIVLEFPLPMKEWNLDSMYYVYSEDTTRLDSILVDKNLEFNFNHTEVSFPKFYADSAFSLIFTDNAFVSVKADSTQAKTLNFTIKELDKYGIVEGQVVGSHESFFVQLVTSKGEVIQEVQNERLFSFEYVKPGTYGIRVLIDENNDGIWFPGDFENRIPPEPTAFFPKEIKVEANWEIRREDTIINTDKK
ncbi:Ig-like domain-containing protein [Flammeovirga sp. OC4]|uniref:Ig-like domain-containing protein n=1 Tax=Flammeovirga sp. OC4 TaxID=1382345 RepID=UPI0005C6B9E3|nr:Ig-like domain-containing protein [Flammeovirga sp. OC4]